MASRKPGRASIGISFDGSKKLDQTLGRLELRMRGKPARTAVKRGGTVIAREMRRRAPRNTAGGGVDSQKPLHKSISTVVREYKKTTVSVTGPRLFVAPNPFWVEYGTAPHLISPKGQKGAVGRLRLGQTWVAGAIEHPGAQPRPFVRPSVDAKQGKASEVVSRVFQEEVEKAARG